MSSTVPDFVVGYHLDDDAYRPLAIIVLATTLTHLARISLLVQPTLFELFDLPRAL